MSFHVCEVFVCLLTLTLGGMLGTDTLLALQFLTAVSSLFFLSIRTFSSFNETALRKTAVEYVEKILRFSLLHCSCVVLRSKNWILNPFMTSDNTCGLKPLLRCLRGLFAGLFEHFCKVHRGWCVVLCLSAAARRVTKLMNFA